MGTNKTRTPYQEHLGVGERLVGYGKHAGTAKDTFVLTDKGKLSGKQTEHWDGHVDATIIAPTIHRNGSTGETTTSYGN